MDEALLLRGGLLTVAKLGICTSWSADWIRPAITERQYHAIPFEMWLEGEGFILMQDNDLKHTRKLCQRYIKCKEEKHVLQLMSWLAQSADLNPIELVWNGVNWKVAAHLWQFLQENWTELSSVYLQCLVERMQRISEAVIAAKRYHFDESKA